jgi:hypothetical protein
MEYPNRKIASYVAKMGQERKNVLIFFSEHELIATEHDLTEYQRVKKIDRIKTGLKALSAESIRLFDYVRYFSVDVFYLLKILIHSNSIFFDYYRLQFRMFIKVLYIYIYITVNFVLVWFNIIITIIFLLNKYLSK